MNKLLVTGLTGQVGRAIKAKLDPSTWDVFITGRDELDITNAKQISAVFTAFKPDVVINTAAYTHVDKAEQDQQENAQSINAHGVYLLATQCKKMDIFLIHLSTDYIFNGQSERAYLEDDYACPTNFYGLTKWQGDLYIRACLIKYIIIRTSWIFSEQPKNFVSTLLELIGRRADISVVDDQIGCPTYAGDIADLLLDIADDYIYDRGLYDFGEYNYCGAESVSWYEFACVILEESAKHISLADSYKIKGLSSEAYSSLAKRPKYSVLNCNKIANLVKQPDWRKALNSVVNTFYMKKAI